MIIKNFFFLNKISFKKISLNRTLIKIEPFTNSFSDTIGNFIRRTCFVTNFSYNIQLVKFYNIYSEYSDIIGVKENINSILKNLNKIIFNINNDISANLIIKKKGPCVIKAKDIFSDKKIIIINPEIIIANVTTEIFFFVLMKCIKSNLKLKNYDNFKKKIFNSKVIKLNFQKSLLLNINYFILNKIYNKKIKKLFFDIETNGEISPEICFKNCIFYIKKYFDIIFNLINIKNKKTIKFKNIIRIIPVFLRSIDNLELSIKSSNFLKSKDIFLIGDLIKKSEKYFNEINTPEYLFLDIKKSLENKNLKFNTKINYEIQF